MIKLLASFLCLAALAASATAQTSQPATTSTATFVRTEDIIYGRSYGTALTLDMFKPTVKQNGAAVIVVVSGGWFSAHESIGSGFFAAFVEPLTKRGYTVFAVCHGCQPKYQLTEIVDMIDRSVRFVRYHADDYGIDPKRFGITGGSAGGHLSLMQAFAAKPAKKDAADPIDRVSSDIQAVACFFPPTDFLNYGKEGHNAIDDVLGPFMGAFDFAELNPKTKKLERITDHLRVVALERSMSPMTYVSKGCPPTLIVHGDKDMLVPIQQAELVINKLKEFNVPCELRVNKGGGHGWGNMGEDMTAIADWFDKYLGSDKEGDDQGER